MKKLLSILAAVGLTATASTAVVACSSSVKAKDVTTDSARGTASFKVSVTLKKGATLTAVPSTDPKPADAPADWKAPTDHYSVASTGFALMMEDKITDATTKKTSDIKKDTKVEKTASFTMAAPADVKNLGTDGKLTKDTSVKVTVTVSSDALKNTSANAGKSVKWTFVKLNDTDATKVDKVLTKVNIDVTAAPTATASLTTIADAKYYTFSVDFTARKGELSIPPKGTAAPVATQDGQKQVWANGLWLSNATGIDSLNDLNTTILAPENTTTSVSTADYAKLFGADGTTPATTDTKVTLMFTIKAAELPAYKTAFTYKFNVTVHNAPVFDGSVDNSPANQVTIATVSIAVAADSTKGDAPTVTPAA